MNNTAIAAIGHNSKNAPTDEEDLRLYLEEESAATRKRAKDLEDALTKVPAVISDDETEAKVTTLVSQIQTCSANLEKLRIKHKKPFWDAGKLVDAFFVPFTASMENGARKGTKIINSYRESKRQAAAKEAADIAARAKIEEDKRLADAAEKEREAAKAREAAEKLLREAQASGSSALTKAAEAAQKEAEALTDQASNSLDSAMRMETRGAKFDDLAKSGARAEITRSDEGGAAMDKKEWKAEVTDAAIFDLEEVRHLLTADMLQKLINGRKAEYVAELKANPAAPVPVIRGARIWSEMTTVVRR